MVENKHLKNIGLHNKTPTSDANLEQGQKTMMTKLATEKRNTNKRNNVE